MKNVTIAIKLMNDDDFLKSIQYFPKTLILHYFHAQAVITYFRDW